MVESWGLPLTLGEIDVPALARTERRSLEDAARSAGYGLLRKVAHGKPVAVAHHDDDQVETLLLHWLGGSGLAGMVGMLPRQQDIIRPLLEVHHVQAVAYCQEHGIVPLEDLSNTDPRFLRNRIRYELIPLLESLNPGIQDTLLRNAEVIRIDLAWLEAQVDAYWSGVVIAEQSDTIKLHVQAFLALPLSLQRHLLRRIAARLCDGQSPLEIRHYTLIEQLLAKHHDRQERTLHLPHQLRVRYDFNELIFERLADAVPGVATTWKQRNAGEEAALLPVPGRVEVPGTRWLAVAESLPGEVMGTVREALTREGWAQVWRSCPLPLNFLCIYGAVGG